MTSPSSSEQEQLIIYLASSEDTLKIIQEQFPQATAQWVLDVLRGRAPKEEKPRAQQDLSGSYILNTDGACRGNPGPSGAGWVVTQADGQVVRTGQSFLGRATNNEAEYIAVVLGLEDAISMGIREMLLRADSELLIKQVKGQYRVKNVRLKPLYDQVKALARQFGRFQCEHVRREYNSAADKQANLAIDEK